MVLVGRNSCTPAQYNQLYVKTLDILTKAGCNNIVWAWSPNLGSEKTVEKFLERFPGEKYVDMLGVDVYEFDNSDANYQQNLAATLDVLMEAAKKVARFLPSTETGCQGYRQQEGLVYPNPLACTSEVSVKLCSLLA